MNTNSKDTLYVDVDDEITGIIDKVSTAKQDIVALVLPKRAAVMQSIVNMKLLKRTADDLNKKVVLITSEAGLLPLAGAAGLHVAKNLQTKPTIPTGPVEITDEPVDAQVDEDIPLDKKAPVGALAGLPPEKPAEDTIELDNSKAAAGAAVASAGKPNKKLKVPNFESFRKRLILGGVAVVALIVLWVLAFMVLPKAHVTVATDNSDVNSQITTTASPAAKTLDASKNLLPAIPKQLRKTDSEKVAATGQRDEGTRATGTMTLTNCINDGQGRTIPAGTTFSSGNFTFATTEAVKLDPALFSGQECRSGQFGLSRGVPVAATQSGDNHNLSARNYNSSIGGIAASGSDMSGGTSKIVKIVNQADVEGAKQKILERNNPQAAEELKKQFEGENSVGLTDTLTTEASSSSNPAVNEPANDLLVTLIMNYGMSGVKKDDVKVLLEQDVKKQIDTTKQNIRDNGLSKATYKVTEKAPNGDAKLVIQATATTGAQQDAAAIQQAVAGKKRIDGIKAVETRPGVKSVTIKYSPFWVSSTPKKLGKIKVTFEQSNEQPAANTDKRP